MDLVMQDRAWDGETEGILTVLRRIAVEKLEMTPARLERIRPDASLVEVLELDSLAQVMFVLEIEEHYGFQFDPEEIARVQTIADLVGVIRSRSPRDSVDPGTSP
jgi:acyl carrier protein